MRRPHLSVPEVLLSAGLVAWGLAEAVALPSEHAVALRVLVALLATVPLIWRNVVPGAVTLWTVAILALQERTDVLPVTGVTPYQCVCLATYALTASDRRGRTGAVAAAALVVAFPAFLLLMDTDGSYEVEHAVGTTLVQLTIVVAGTMIRARRLEARRADALLQAESQTAPARLAAAIADERTVIARELRAIVTSELAEIDRLLGETATGLADGDGLRARRRAETVQTTAARAVVEMRQLLAALSGVHGRAASDAGDLEHRRAEDADRGAGARDAQWWRDRAADLAVLVPLIVVLGFELARLTDGLLLGVVAGLGLVVTPAVLRRRWPLAAASVLAAGLVVRELTGTMPSLPITLMPVLIVGGYAVAAFAATDRRALIGAGALVVGGLSLAILQLDEGGAWPDLPVVLFVLGCSFAAGQLVRENDGRILTLRAGTAELAAEHRRRRDAAREAERRRAARELHDVVAHGVSLIAVQSGAAAALAERDADAAARATALATEALTQTRRDLGRLADVLGVGEQAPPPRAADLTSLVESARRAGQRVELRIRGPIDGLAAEVGVSLYRIVQESLTNARKHAAGGATTIEIDVRADRATLVATTGPETPDGARAATAVPGSGRGVAGMRERARLLGGDLEAGPTPDGGFVVAATLPLR